MAVTCRIITCYFYLSVVGCKGSALVMQAVLTLVYSLVIVAARMSKRAPRIHTDIHICRPNNNLTYRRFLVCGRAFLNLLIQLRPLESSDLYAKIYELERGSGSGARCTFVWSVVMIHSWSTVKRRVVESPSPSNLAICATSNNSSRPTDISQKFGTETEHPHCYHHIYILLKEGGTLLLLHWFPEPKKESHHQKFAFLSDIHSLFSDDMPTTGKNQPFPVVMDQQQNTGNEGIVSATMTTLLKSTQVLASLFDCSSVLKLVSPPSPTSATSCNGSSRTGSKRTIMLMERGRSLRRIHDVIEGSNHDKHNNDTAATARPNGRNNDSSINHRNSDPKRAMIHDDCGMIHSLKEEKERWWRRRRQRHEHHQEEPRQKMRQRRRRKVHFDLNCNRCYAIEPLSKEEKKMRWFSSTELHHFRSDTIRQRGLSTSRSSSILALPSQESFLSWSSLSSLWLLPFRMPTSSSSSLASSFQAIVQALYKEEVTRRQIQGRNQQQWEEAYVKLISEHPEFTGLERFAVEPTTFSLHHHPQSSCDRDLKKKTEKRRKTLCRRRDQQMLLMQNVQYAGFFSSFQAERQAESIRHSCESVSLPSQQFAHRIATLRSSTRVPF